MNPDPDTAATDESGNADIKQFTLPSVQSKQEREYPIQGFYRRGHRWKAEEHTHVETKYSAALRQGLLKNN